MIAFTPPDPSRQCDDMQAVVATFAAEQLLEQHYWICQCDRCKQCRLVLAFTS